MLDFDSWASSGASPIDAPSRAGAALRRIQEKPTQIVLVRGSAAMDAQTVRIEFSNSTVSSEYEGAAGNSGHQTSIIFGVRGHASEPDTDIQRGDRFAHSGVQFRVVSLVETIGEVQAMCEALS